MEADFKPRHLYPPQAPIRIPEESLLSHREVAEMMLGNCSAVLFLVSIITFRDKARRRLGTGGSGSLESLQQKTCHAC